MRPRAWRIAIGAPVLALLQATSAFAQEVVEEIAATGAAEPAVVPAPASPPPEPPWSITLSAGVGARDDGPDGSWQALALNRTLGRGYVRAALMRYHGTLTQSDAGLPSDYVVGTVGAGGNFNGWVIDGWASYGRQYYGRISDASGTRASTGARSSGYQAIGGDLGRVLPLGQDWYLTPTVAASFAYGKLLRPAPTNSGLTDLETAEPTWSANAAVRLDRVFGASRQHYAGLTLSRNWTSNGVSSLRIKPLDPTVPGAGLRLDSKHTADAWIEAGAAASMALGSDLHIDLFATRSFGVLAGNLTNAGVSLRRSF